jgi:hypothetical protein
MKVIYMCPEGIFSIPHLTLTRVVHDRDPEKLSGKGCNSRRENDVKFMWNWLDHNQAFPLCLNMLIL